MGEAFNLALVGHEPPPKNQKAYESRNKTLDRLHIGSSVLNRHVVCLWINEY